MLKKPLYTTGATDADATAWCRAVGLSPNAPRARLIQTLIRGLKSDGVWPLLTRAFPFAAQNNVQALTDLKARATATAVNTPTFSADRGFAGDGAASYVNLGTGPGGSLNSCHFTQYVQNYVAGQNAWFGVNDGSGSFLGLAPDSVARVTPQLNSSTNTNITTAGGSGLYIIDRSASNLVTVARNGADVATATDATTGQATSNVFVGAENGGGTARFFHTCRLGFVTMGSSLGVTGRAALANRINAYMTALGANTY